MAQRNGVPTSFGAAKCALCQVSDATWACDLDPGRARFKVYGDGHVWSSRIRLCDRCEQLLRGADVDGLTAVDPRSSSLNPADLEEQVRNGLRALVSSVVRLVSMDETRPNGYRGLVAEGFTPLEEITGALYLAEAWPADHRRSLPARDDEDASQLPGGRHWFIQSPWASVPLRDLFDLVIRAVDDCTRDIEGTTGATRFTEARAIMRVHELLASSEEDIRRRMRS